MVEITEIQIFVSCPGDVANEKDVTKEVCARLNKILEKQNCPIRYLVKGQKI